MYTEEQNDGIYIERKKRVPGFTMHYEHLHPYYEIFYLKKGSCVYSVNNSLYHLSSGDVFIVTPGAPHCTRYEGSVSCERTVVYCMPHAIPASFRESHPFLQDKLSRSGKVILSEKGRPEMELLLDKMLAENNIPDKFSYEFLQLLMMTLLLNIERNGIFIYEKIKSDKGFSTDIETALRYIAENYSSPLSLEEVAEKVNLAPTYLSRKFKKVTGTTFSEYVNYIRIRQAGRLLLTTDDSVTGIALSCGFNSSNYFKDCFRQITGMSPRTFRKNTGQHSFEIENKP